RILRALQDADGAADLDGAAEQEMVATLLDQRAGDRVGIAILRGAMPDALGHDLLAHLGRKALHISASVESSAGPISPSPASEDLLMARRRTSRASSSAIPPPIDDPITTCGPAQNCVNTATPSSNQRPMVPSAKAPPDSPWPE